MSSLNKGDSLPTSPVANLNLESEGAADIVQTQDLPEKVRELVTNLG